MVDRYERIVSRELVRVVSDRQWHNIYELHDKYRVSPESAFKVVSLFLSMGILEKRGAMIRLSSDLSDAQMAALNSLCKTRRPKLPGRRGLTIFN